MRLRSVAVPVVSLIALVSCAEGSSLTRADRKTRAAEQPSGESEERRRAGKPHATKRNRKPAQPKAARPKRRSKPRRGPLAYVSRVVDGDTIEVDLRGAEVDVRLIGFDTPETVHPSEPVECFGRAASDYTSDALQDRTVHLEFDVERRDRYGRTLAYVWIGRTLFNEKILRDGYAAVSTYPPNVRYVDRFLTAQQRARESDRGLWASCGGVDKPAAPKDTGGGGVGGSKSVAAGTGNCDANYAGACIPSYPPDLDCSEVDAVGFRSNGTDPHGFDGDADGIACES